MRFLIGLLIIMSDNNIVHRFVVPLGYTFSWFLGICLGVDFFDLFGHKYLLMESNPTNLWFYNALSVYFAFLLECVFIFIDCGAIYKEERFNGKLFYLFAGIFFHFFVTMWLVGVLMSKMDVTLVYVFTAWVVVFKFGISIMSANMRYWLTERTIRIVTSNKVK